MVINLKKVVEKSTLAVWLRKIVSTTVLDNPGPARIDGSWKIDPHSLTGLIFTRFAVLYGARRSSLPTVTSSEPGTHSAGWRALIGTPRII
jgi:hypothetical protein